MSAQEGNRDNQYSFDDFLFVRDNFNYYSDDEFFQALVRKYTGDEFNEIDRDLRALSDYVSFRFRDLANSANQLENRIKCTRVKHFNAFNHRIDRIERCLETEILEREIFSLGLFDPTRNTPWSRGSSTTTRPDPRGPSPPPPPLRRSPPRGSPARRSP